MNGSMPAAVVHNRPRSFLSFLPPLLVAGGMALAVPAVAAAETETDGFVSIFDGVSTRGWVGNTQLWRVENGAITGQTTKEKPAPRNTFLVWKGGRVSDFVLRFSYRIFSNNDKGFANSGVQYRSRVTDIHNFAVIGYQADIEAGPTFSGILYDEGGGAGNRGIMAGRGEKVVWDPDGKKQVAGSLGQGADLQKVIKPDDWNEYEISVRGYHFVHKINGTTMVDVIDNSTNRVPSGILALQLHAGEPMTVQFRNIRLKNLDKTIVLVAGGASHGSGDHEHQAGCMLLKHCLDYVPGVRASVITNGWPLNPDIAFTNAAAIALYSDGGGGHPFIQGDRLAVLAKYMKQGVGLGLIHYAVEVPKDRGGKEFLEWAGGYFETYWSVNPFWEADFKSLPPHPVTTGVNPFKIVDEWYYHMRFPDGMKNVTPILSAVPPDTTRGKPGANEPHGGNPEVQKHMGEPEHVMWVTERPEGGRGFGFTGGHAHKNWANDDFRKIILNALLWIAKVDVPPNGADLKPTPEQLSYGLDRKGN